MYRAIKVTLLYDRQAEVWFCAYPTHWGIVGADLVKPFVFRKLFLAGIRLLAWQN